MSRLPCIFSACPAGCGAGGLGQRLAARVAPGGRRLGARAYLLLALIFTLGIWSDVGPFKLVAATEGKLFDIR